MDSGTEAEWWTAYATIALAIVTTALWVATGLLWFSTRKAVRSAEIEINHSKVAAEAATTASLAATRQAAASEKALIAGFRPYLVVEPLFENATIAIVGKPTFRFRFRMTNHGEATAILTASDYGIVSMPNGSLTFEPTKIPTPLQYLVLEPGKSTAGYDPVFPTESVEHLDYSSIASGETPIYAYGRFSYESPSGYKHETRFCWKLRNNGHQFAYKGEFPEWNFRS